MAPFGCRGNMELVGRFWTKECSEMSADDKILALDCREIKSTGPIPFPSEIAFPRWFLSLVYGNCGYILPLECHEIKRVQDQTRSQIKKHLQGGFCDQLTFQSILWFKTFPLAPCSCGTQRVSRARLRWPIQSMTLDTYHILFYTSPNAGFESDLAMVTVK